MFEGADAVVHLAANADVRFGLEHPRRDLDQNVIVTHNVLEAVRTAGVPELVFSSTGSVYGESEVIPTPEDAPFPRQTSLYGASKAAAEGFIAAYVEGFGLRATVYRFVSILGAGYTHGHVIDFVAQLTDHPDRLHILGDGTQRKSYLEVGDCVARDHGPARTSRAASTSSTSASTTTARSNDSVGWICERLGVEPDADATAAATGDGSATTRSSSSTPRRSAPPVGSRAGRSGTPWSARSTISSRTPRSCAAGAS